MAVETQRRPPPVRVESNGHQSRLRLHEEILPPKLDPSTPAALRRARRALVILAAGVILLQLTSVPIGHSLASRAYSGTDPYSIWQGYLAAPVPEVLVIGASTAQTNIDEAALATGLSNAAGRSVTVSKLGFDGQGPGFYAALVYKIMKRPKHPKLVVVTTEPPDLNAGCTCLAWETGSMADISDVTDPSFVQLALRVVPDPGRLVTDWAIPAVAYYPSLLALQCVVVDFGRGAGRAVLGRVPQQLQNPNICETQPGHLLATAWASQQAMSQTRIQLSKDYYRGFMADYQISPTAVFSFEDIVSRARAGGVNIAFVEVPIHSEARSLFPEAQQAYQQEMNRIASTLGTRIVDLNEAVPDDPSLWVDTVHLNQAGAAYLAPKISSALAPLLGG